MKWEDCSEREDWHKIFKNSQLNGRSTKHCKFALHNLQYLQEQTSQNVKHAYNKYLMKKSSVESLFHHATCLQFSVVQVLH